jgi:hypothetical protein
MEDPVMATSKWVRNKLAPVLACGLVVAVGVAVLAGGRQPASADKPAYRFSGPYTHDNLTIFLVHGEDAIKNKSFLTLPEALEQKKIIIHETKSVNELTMENLSDKEDILILSGDILKGGQQDRVAQFDQILAPKSGKVALGAFCVELSAPRWSQPTGKAEEKQFQGCKDSLCTNALRLAARYAGDQSKVWNEVANTQKKLTMNAKVDVKAKESDTSLQLSLEIKEVRAALAKYVDKLEKITKDKTDVIGYVFAINGKMVSADVYGSGAMFGKLWPRLLKATATEAFADLQKDKKFDPVALAAVQTFFAEADKGKASTKDVSPQIRQITQESERNVQFDTRDRGSQALIRRNILAK